MIGEVEEIGDARAEQAESEHRQQHVRRGQRVGKLREAERGKQEGRETELAERRLQHRYLSHRATREEHRERVTDRDADHGEGRDELASRLEADQEHDSDEPDPDAGEAHAGDALRSVDPRREDDGAEGRRGLDDRGQAGIEARLRESEKPERDGVVHPSEDQEREEVALQWPETASAWQQREQQQRPECDPSESDDGGLEHVDRDLDEEERRAPDRREEQEEKSVAATHGASRVNARPPLRCEVRHAPCPPGPRLD